MTDLIKASQSDWFKNVLDYIGFAPSRFYLRESCKELSEAIPAQLSVSLLEFGVALRQKLVNPRNMYFSPNHKQKSSYVRAILRGYRLLPDRKLRVSIMERILPLLDDALVAPRLRYTDEVEWDAWLEGSESILEKIDSIREYVSKQNDWAPDRDFDLCVWKSDDAAVKDIEMCKRILVDWQRPSTPHQWQATLRNAVKQGVSRDALDFLINESGLELFSVDDIYDAIAFSGNVELMENYLVLRPETHELSREAFARKGNDDMIRLLVGRFGIYEDILPDWFLRGTPNIDTADFLIQRGADINAKHKGWGYTGFRCLDIAFERGQWDLIDELIERGADLEKMHRVFAGPILKDADRFKKYLLDSRLLENEQDKQLLCASIKNGCLGAIADEIFSRIWDPADPTIVREAFEAILIRLENEGELEDLGPFILRLVSLDPSVLEITSSSGVRIMGILTNPVWRRRWCGSQLQHGSIMGRYVGPVKRAVETFGDDDEESDDDDDDGDFFNRCDYEFFEERLDRLSPDWQASSVDPIEAYAMNALRQSLESMGCDPNLWFAPDCLARELSHLQYGKVIYREKFQELIDHGCQIDAVCGAYTALCHAVGMRSENFEILLEFGASVFKPDNSIPSALCWGARSDMNSLPTIYEHARDKPGFDINAFETDFRWRNEAPIHVAARFGRVRNVGLLLDWGADPDLKTRDLGLTPLMIAPTAFDAGKDLEISRMLIDRKCDVNVRDSMGRTVLFTRIAAGSRDIFEMLIENGADVDVNDDYGTRPIDLALFIMKFQDQIRPDDRSFEFNIAGYRRNSPFPGDRAAILDRLKALSKDPNPKPLYFSDMEFARKYGLDTILYILRKREEEQ